MSIINLHKHQSQAIFLFLASFKEHSITHEHIRFCHMWYLYGFNKRQEGYPVFQNLAVIEKT